MARSSVSTEEDLAEEAVQPFSVDDDDSENEIPTEKDPVHSENSPSLSPNHQTIDANSNHIEVTKVATETDSKENNDKKTEQDDSEPTTDDPDKPKLRTRAMKAVFSHVGLTVIVCFYCIAGGLIFEHLELTNEQNLCVEGQFKYRKVLNATIDLLWDKINQGEQSKDEKSNEFHQVLDLFRESVQNGTFYASLAIKCTDAVENPPSWGFFGSLLFSVTVITTIGYGHIAPKTFWGRLVCIAYAMLGIPLMLMCLANIGEVLADTFRFVYSRVCCCGCCRRSDRNQDKTEDKENKLVWRLDEHGKPILVSVDASEEDDWEEEDIDDQTNQVTVPLTISLSVMFGYIMIGASVFHTFEEWSISDSAYFSFVTVSTIGFGDMVPGHENLHDPSVTGKMIFTAFYMLIGMALLSMLFALMQDEVVAKFTWLGEKMGVIKPDEDEEFEDLEDDVMNKPSQQPGKQIAESDKMEEQKRALNEMHSAYEPFARIRPKTARPTTAKSVTFSDNPEVTTNTNSSGNPSNTFDSPPPPYKSRQSTFASAFQASSN